MPARTKSEGPPIVPLLLTTEEAATYAGRSRSAMYLLVADGTIPSVKIGRSRRIARAAVEEYVQALLGNNEPGTS